jgi:sarcosine oxidase subunit delta
MQLFRCPFCGLRDETEFYYGGEAGNTRPEPAPDATAADWARYLYLRANRKGPTREVWMHLTCGEIFVMERDSLSHAVGPSHALHGDTGET